MECYLCIYKSRRSFNLWKHKKGNHEGKSFPCNKCNFKLKKQTRIYVWLTPIKIFLFKLFTQWVQCNCQQSTNVNNYSWLITHVHFIHDFQNCPYIFHSYSRHSKSSCAVICSTHACTILSWPINTSYKMNNGCLWSFNACLYCGAKRSSISYYKCGKWMHYHSAWMHTTL